MLRKVFEVDPLVCPRCGVEMEVVAWVTKPSVVDAILKHRREHGLISPFEARAAGGVVDVPAAVVVVTLVWALGASSQDPSQGPLRAEPAPRPVATGLAGLR